MNDCQTTTLNQTMEAIQTRHCGCMERLTLLSPDGFRWILGGVEIVHVCDAIRFSAGNCMKRRISVDMEA